MLRVLCGLGVLLGLTACGTGGMAGPEAAAGDTEQVFVEKCGGCHTLQAAGTRGTIGPDLDAAFAAARAEGFDESTIREVVLAQLRFPTPPMPPADAPEMFGDLDPAEREAVMQAVAAYVAEVAANEEAIAQAEARRGAGAAADDPEAIFSSQCASCHALAAADARGTIGPDLDRSTLDVAAIERQIREGGGGMPPFEGRLTDAQIEALARFVAESRRP